MAETKFQLQKAHNSKILEENAELKKQIVYIQAELDHAKKNLVAYI